MKVLRSRVRWANEWRSVGQNSILLPNLSYGRLTGVNAKFISTPVTLPTGPGFVRFEDRYTSSMGPSNLALQKVIDTVTDGSILTLPEDVFTIGSGGWDGTNDGTFNPALWIKKTCGGLWGSGRGFLGSSEGTVIQVAENTAVNPTVGGCAIYSGNAASLTLKNIHFSGTYQGKQTQGGGPNGIDGVSEKLWTMIYVTQTAKVLCEDLLINGWYGNNGAPPGETFGLQIYRTNDGQSNHIVRRCEFDGRRSVGGPSYGCVGLTSGTCNGWYWEDVYSHHSNVGMALVAYQTVNGTSVRSQTGSKSDNDGTSQFGKKAGGINHERTANTTHISPNIYVPTDGSKVHFYHSNDAFALNGIPTTDGKLTITDPVWNYVWGNQYLYVETWGPPYGPDTNWGSTETIHTAPTVKLNNSDIPYRWVRNGIHNVTTSGTYIN